MAWVQGKLQRTWDQDALAPAPAPAAAQPMARLARRAGPQRDGDSNASKAVAAASNHHGPAVKVNTRCLSVTFLTRSHASHDQARAQKMSPGPASPRLFPT